MEKTIFRDYLTIDAETRKISIPSRIENLGVESDAGVKRLYFKIQKQYGEMDFTKADIRINYVNANGEGDTYAVKDKQVEGGTVTFSWLVRRSALKYKGDVCFIACAKTSNTEGIVEKEFNSTLATLPVLEGIETTQQIVQQYPDVIEQILKKLEGATTITPEQIQTAVDKYLKNNPITIEETDPTVPEWVKQGKNPFDEIGQVNNTLENYLGIFTEGEVPEPEPPQESVNLFDVNKAEKGYYDATTGKLQNLEGYRTITLPYKTTDVIRKSKDVEWFTTWILLLDGNKQPILSQINLVSGNNFANPGWDEWKLPEETLQNEPKYQDAKYIKVACSTFGPTKDFNKFMVTINNPLPDHYVPPTTTKTRTKEFTYSENLAAFIRHIAGGGSVTPIPPTTGTALDGKTIVFVGDSITAGFVQEQGLPNYGQRNGYVEMLQKKYPKAVFKNLAVGGATVGHYEGEPTPCVVEQINNAITQYPNADYIIIQGGVNDTWLSSKVSLGEISSGYAATLNEGTFCGALESIFKKAQTQWIGKRIGFLTTHKIPSAPSLENYMDKAREICKKWSVPYLDLYNLSTLNYAIAEVKSNLSYKTADHPNGDGTHPNVKGYEVLTPKIESWLLEL